MSKWLQQKRSNSTRTEKYPELPENQLQSHINYLLPRLMLYPVLKMLRHFADFPLSCSMRVELYDEKVLELTESHDGTEIHVTLTSVDLYESLTKKNSKNSIQIQISPYNVQR